MGLCKAHISRLIIWCVAGFFCCATALHAQETRTLDPVYEGAGLDQKNGAFIPLDLVFNDESGEPVSLGAVVNGEKPVLLAMVYHSCPMMCNVVLDALTDAMAEMAWTAGEEFDVLTISIAPEDTPETAREKKAHYLEKLGKADVTGWHFLTGNEPEIQQLADAIGFRYDYVEEIGQYVHPPILTFLTPEGQISRYMQGVAFSARDMRLSLVEASGGKIGTPKDFFILYCLQYDNEASAYVAHATNLMKLGGALTVLVLGVALYGLWRKEGQNSEPHQGLAT